MSAEERPATRIYKQRWRSLLSFWKDRQRGEYDRDLTEWRIEQGLTPRTAKENYWNAGETLGKIRIVFEKNQRFWEYCDSPVPEGETATQYMQRKTAEKKPKLSAVGTDFFGRMEIREKMDAGYCKNDWLMTSDSDCRTCGIFRKHRPDFPESKEEE